MRYIAITILLLTGTVGFAQKPDIISPLQVGDSLPDLSFRNVLNVSTGTINFSDFKGKLLILDFWNSFCSSCIESWPKLLGLQKEFEGQLQIILVNPRESEAKVRQVFSKRKQFRNIDVTLPTIYQDSRLLSLFPMLSVPTIVWVDKDGIIFSVTNNSEVNSENIRKIFEGSNLGMKQKKEVVNDNWDMTQSIFERKGAEGEMIWQSVLAGEVEGVKPGESLFTSEKYGYRIGVFNASIWALYRFAYSDHYVPAVGDKPLLMMPTSRTSVEIDNPSRYALYNGTDREVIYTYELTAPPTTADQLQQWMREDLDRYFGLNARVEKREVDCLVFGASDTSRISYKGGESQFLISDIEFKVNGTFSFDYIVYFLMEGTKYYYSKYPIINETGLKGRVGNIEFSADIGDPKALDRAFRRYGVSFTIQQRNLNVLVLSE